MEVQSCFSEWWLDGVAHISHYERANNCLLYFSWCFVHEFHMINDWNSDSGAPVTTFLQQLLKETLTEKWETFEVIIVSLNIGHFNCHAVIDHWLVYASRSAVFIGKSREGFVLQSWRTSDGCHNVVICPLGNGTLPLADSRWHWLAIGKWQDVSSC